MRLIDADALIEQIEDVHCKDCDSYNGVRCRACDICIGIDYLEDAPTFDPWHYPSKGELPTEGDKYLVVLFKDDEIPYIAEIKDGWFKKPVFSEYLCPVDSDDVICWQYIVPPKEEA